MPRATIAVASTKRNVSGRIAARNSDPTTEPITIATASGTQYRLSAIAGSMTNRIPPAVVSSIALSGTTTWGGSRREPNATTTIAGPNPLTAFTKKPRKAIRESVI